MAQSRMNTDNPVTLSIPRENRKTTTKFRVTEERKDGSKRQTTHSPPALRVQALSITGGERETQRDAVSLPKDTWFTAAGVRSPHFLLT